jgi:hypothetical protein
MLSSTAPSTSFRLDASHSQTRPSGSVPWRIKYLAEPMLTLGSSAWTDEPPPTDDISDHRIESLFSAITRWPERPEIIQLLAGLDLPLKTDELRTEARRRLPYIVDAINDAEVAAQEQASQVASVLRHRAEAVDRIDPRELASSRRMNVVMAAANHGYRGPENRGASVAAVASAAAQLGMTLDDKTIRKHLD